MQRLVQITNVADWTASQILLELFPDGNARVRSHHAEPMPYRIAMPHALQSARLWLMREADLGSLTEIVVYLHEDARWLVEWGHLEAA